MKVMTILFLKHISVATESSHIFYKYKAVVRRVLKTLIGKRKSEMLSNWNEKAICR